MKRRHGRKSRSSNSIRLPLSLLFFVASTAVFLRQLTAPLTAIRTTVKQRSTSSKPTNWFPSKHIIDTTQHSSLPIRQNSAPSKPRHWFPSSPISADNLPSIIDIPQSIDSIPDGPYPLPHLALHHPNATKHAAGSSWTASFAQGIRSALPLHWLAEAAHPVPQEPQVHTDSIFVARRKGAWIGCARPFHLVCKGVYRAIKITDSIHVLDLSCENNLGWLPYILQKLRTEFRLVQLSCVVSEDAMADRLRGSFSTMHAVRFLKLNPLVDPFPNGTDMLIAYKYLEKANLIAAMKLFKNVKASGTVRLLTTESFSDEENIPKREGDSFLLRLNTGAAPFLFPPPTFEYENEQENFGDTPMTISTVKVEELFQEKLTPSMDDLVDPRKRLVRE